jgi:hypothetical protein
VAASDSRFVDDHLDAHAYVGLDTTQARQGIAAEGLTMRYLLAALLFFSTNVAAEQIGVVAKGQERIELHDTPIHGLCPKELKEAMYVAPQGQVPGCWRFEAERGAILTIFADGDVFLIPLGDFSWKAGKRPVIL